MCISGMPVTSVSLGCFGTGRWATVQLDWCGSEREPWGGMGIGWHTILGSVLTLSIDPASIRSARSLQSQSTSHQSLAAVSIRQGYPLQNWTYKGQHHIHLWQHLKDGFHKKGKKLFDSATFLMFINTVR